MSPTLLMDGQSLSCKLPYKRGALTLPGAQNTAPTFTANASRAMTRQASPPMPLWLDGKDTKRQPNDESVICFETLISSKDRKDFFAEKTEAALFRRMAYETLGLPVSAASPLQH